MEYNFNLEHPFYFTDSSYSEDTSTKYNIELPYVWHEVRRNDEWVFQYPIGKFIERQGWKIHISSEYNISHSLLEIVAKICHTMKIPFKHLSSEDEFIMRNSKLMNRGFSGKFITCYSNQSELKHLLNRFEDELIEFNSPYILNDKRLKKALVYLRYEVFRPTKSNENEVAIDELITGNKIIKDERLPQFKVPEGLSVPDFLDEWLNNKTEEDNQGEFPFVIESVIRFSNSGGLYNARLKDNDAKIILKEA